MAAIYENAFITIAATCAANSDDGLRPFGDRFRALRLGSSNFFVREWIADRSRIYESRYNKFWPLLSRAWAFQESQLAPRTLRFSCYGTVWDCRTTKAAQARRRVGHDVDVDTIDLLPFFSARKTILSPIGKSTSDPSEAWRNTVGEYSRLDLTYRTDTLPAIAALAQRMARLRPDDTYLAGMWRNTLLFDIQWQASGFHLRQDSALPTWSWASTQEAHYSTIQQHTLPNVEILDLNYTPVGPAEIGAIKDAVLTIRGPTLPLQVQAAESVRSWFEFRTLHQVASWSDLRLNKNLDYNPSPNFYLDGSHALLALFMNGTNFNLGGLILRQVGTTYERVGWFDFFAHMQKQASESLMERIAQIPLTTVRII